MIGSIQIYGIFKNILHWEDRGSGSKPKCSHLTSSSYRQLKIDEQSIVLIKHKKLFLILRNNVLVFRHPLLVTISVGHRNESFREALNGPSND